MTRELLQEANRLNHAIIEIEEQIRRVEEIRQSNQPLHLPLVLYQLMMLS